MAEKRNFWEELGKSALSEVALRVAGAVLQGVANCLDDDKTRLSEGFGAQKARGVAADEKSPQNLPTWVTNPQIVDLTRQINLKPTAELYCRRGSAYSAEYQHGLAIADFNRAIELDPNLADVYCHRGAAHLWSSDPDLAISDLTRAIHFAPNNAEAYYYRGYAYNEKVAFDAVKRKKHAHTLHRVEWSWVYGYAIADLTRAIELNPDYAEAYSCRGVSYNATGEHDLAIADFNRAIELNPADAGAYRDRAEAHEKKGMHGHSIDDLSRWAELEPDNAAPYFLRGSIYYKEGQRARGRADLMRAVDMGVYSAEDARKIDPAFPVKQAPPRRRWWHRL